MFKSIAAVSAVALSAATFTGPAAAHDHRHVARAPIQITVSCARYVSRQVIWDRPMPVFLDGLRAAGYSPERAQAIGERVCRDEAGVGNTAYTGALMQEILRTNPPRR